MSWKIEHEIAAEKPRKRRTANDLRAYRDEYDGVTTTKANYPEDWEEDLFSEDDRKEHRKNEKDRHNRNRTANGRAPSGGTRFGAVDVGGDTRGCGRPSAPADNMGVSKLPEAAFRRVYGGFDGGIEVGLSGSWRSAGSFVLIHDKLADAKKEAEDEPEGKKIIELQGRKIAVWSKGASGNVKYKFVAEYKGTKIYIHGNPQGNIQPFRIRFGFQCLAVENVFEAFEEFVEWVEAMGFQVTGDKISRVDMQVMTHRPVNEYVDKIRNNQAVMKVRGDAKVYERNGKCSSYSIGKRSVELCIYDKRKQILQSDAVDYDIFRREILDNGDLPEVLTRLEFRVMREMLKRYGVNSMEDLREDVLPLIEILTTDWFRILSEPKRRSYENVQKIDVVWQEVIDLFNYYFNEENQPKRRTAQQLREHVPTPLPYKTENLIKQAVGCLSSVAAFSRFTFRNTAAIMEFIVDHCEKYADKFAEKYEIKRNLNAIIRGFVAEDFHTDMTEAEDYSECIRDEVYDRVRADIKQKFVLASEVPF